jgi:8-oxo-dGTP pyrophosphatase MutT (NUDIX family)
MTKENIDRFLPALKHRLTLTLPGQNGHAKMEPSTRKEFLMNLKHATGPRKSAVMILLFTQDNELHTFFIERNVYDGVHSGQISFPGGGFEKTDKDLFHTALRETQEEIGIQAADIHILGNLTELYIPPSNFDVFPVVGFLDKEPQLDIDTSEVQKVFKISLSELRNRNNIGKGIITIKGGREVEVPCFWLDNHMVWGATSMILSEFIEVVDEIFDSYPAPDL